MLVPVAADTVIERFRSDYVLADCATDGPACNQAATCPDESAYRPSCGSSCMNPVPLHDDDTEYYGATYVVDVSADALGTFALGVDPDPAYTFLMDDTDTVLAPITLIPALITVPPSARPLPDDAIDISGTVVPCTSDAECLAGLSVGSEIACVAAPSDGGGQATCYVRRNRYVSIKANPNNTGLSTGRRVQLATGETLGWVGPPMQVTVAGPGPSPQWLSRIEPEAHYMDWNTIGTVHLGDCEISPDRTYSIAAILGGHNVDDESKYSEPLLLATVTAFGDVVGGTAGTPPDADRNFRDISAVVRGFQSTQSEPKVWLDLQGSGAAPELPDFSNVNFSDITWAVAGFQGSAYPFAVPCDCPGQSCP